MNSMTGRGQPAGFAGLRVPVAEGDGLRVVGEDRRIGQRHAVEVARQIAQHVLAVAHRFGVHDPVPPPDLLRHSREHLWQPLAQGIAEAQAEELGQRPDRDQELGPRLSPSPVGPAS